MAKRPSTKPLPITWIILILVIAGAAWYFTQREAPEEAEPSQVDIPEEKGVEKGDLVAIDFVLKLANGTVVDTNDEQLAKEYNVTRYVKGPFRFIVGQSSKLKGFDTAVLGMTLGEERTRIIPPSEPVLQYSINRTRSISRNQPVARFQPVTLKSFEKTFKKRPVIGDVATSKELPWSVKVKNVTENHVIIEPLVSEGKKYRLPGSDWESTLLVKTFNDLLFRHNPEDGQMVSTEFGQAIVNPGPGRINFTYMAELGDVLTYYAPIQDAISIPYTFEITDVNSANFTLTRIDYLPQETLVLTATLLEWEPDVNKRRTVVAQ